MSMRRGKGRRRIGWRRQCFDGNKAQTRPSTKRQQQKQLQRQNTRAIDRPGLQRRRQRRNLVLSTGTVERDKTCNDCEKVSLYSYVCVIDKRSTEVYEYTMEHRIYSTTLLSNDCLNTLRFRCSCASASDALRLSSSSVVRARPETGKDTGADNRERSSCVCIRRRRASRTDWIIGIEVCKSSLGSNACWPASTTTSR